MISSHLIYSLLQRRLKRASTLSKTSRLEVMESSLFMPTTNTSMNYSILVPFPSMVRWLTCSEHFQRKITALKKLQVNLFQSSITLPCLLHYSTRILSMVAIAVSVWDFHASLDTVHLPCVQHSCVLCCIAVEGRSLLCKYCVFKAISSTICS